MTATEFRADADARAEIEAAVRRRHPDMTGEAFNRKVRRVMAIRRHSQHGPTWTKSA